MHIIIYTKSIYTYTFTYNLVSTYIYIYIVYASRMRYVDHKCMHYENVNVFRVQLLRNLCSVHNINGNTVIDNIYIYTTWRE